MLMNIIIFVASLLLLIKGATIATRHAAKLAESFQISKYVIGFLVIAVISILPETFISINAALEGIPAFGLGTLFGSNVADLTLVFALIVFTVGRGIKVESKILKNNLMYPLLLMIPMVLGVDGYYSRLEGIALIISGGAFYYIAFKNGGHHVRSVHLKSGRYKHLFLLLLGMAALLIGSHFTVTSAAALAQSLGINPILIGMLIVGLGTTMPELFFSLKSVQKHDDALAVGDILGTVLADATVVVGILALVSPFYFSQKIIYITGLFMVVASLILFYFMYSEKTLSKKESYILVAFWLLFVLVEFIANT